MALCRSSTKQLLRGWTASAFVSARPFLSQTFSTRTMDRGGQRREGMRVISRVVDVGRVATVTASGKVLSIRALVVAGNGTGVGGFGIGRGPTAQKALAAALREAKKDMVPVDLSPQGTLFHDVMGKHNNTLVLMRSVGAKHQNGIKGSKIVRGVCDVIGIKHLVAKVVTRGKNPYSIVNAIFNGLGKHTHPDEVSLLRGRRVQRMYK